MAAEAELMATDGVFIRDEFLSAGEIQGLIDCFHARKSRGDFSAARIGAGPGLQRREDIRGDHICWLEQPLFPAEHSLLIAVERLRLEINQILFLGLIEAELHYAWYPPGAGYARHVDRPRGSAGRAVSLVLYLNQNWVRGVGGELRLFGERALQQDIEPIAGRLVCFMTADREHSVLPTRQDRLSISGWFRTRD